MGDKLPRYEMWRQYVNHAKIAYLRVEDIRDWAKKSRRFGRRHVFHGTLQVGSRGPRRDMSVPWYVVSHPWIANSHPDPEGHQLRQLKSELDRIGAPDNGLVFYDYSSLYQGHRTDEQHELFKRALEGFEHTFVTFPKSVIV